MSSSQDHSEEVSSSRAESELDIASRDLRDFTGLPKENQQKLARQYFLSSTFDKLYELLEEVKGLDLTTMCDKKYYTLVHSLVLNQNLGDLRFVVEYAKMAAQMKPDGKQTIAEWLDSPSEGGFTALHYASYRGEIGMANYLMENGANFRAKNTKGLNVMHIAAQNDQTISLRFFQKHGMDPKEMEFKQGNALHWASFLGSENAILYLTSYSDIDINQPDEQGLSPLHLAVISGNARAVKRLLIKGADRRATDEKGNTPSQLAAQEGYQNIQAMIETEGGLEEYCNLKQPFRPTSKNLKQVSIFFCLFLSTQLIFTFFVVPCLNEGYIELSVWLGLSILSIIFHLFAWLSNPGEVTSIDSSESQFFYNIQQAQMNRNTKKKTHALNRSSLNKHSIKSKDESNTSSLVIHDKFYQSHLKQSGIKDPLLPINQQQSLNSSERVWNDELLMLLQVYPVDKVCIECCVLKPLRSKHCEVCKRCIRVYDHHCPWINNCVGANNYAMFLLFIVNLWLNKLVSITLTILHIADSFSDKDEIFNWYQSFSEDTRHTLFIPKLIGSSIILFIAVPFFCMLTALVFVQVNNFFRNMTTFERFSRKLRQEGFQDSTLSTGTKGQNAEDNDNNTPDNESAQPVASQRKKSNKSSSFTKSSGNNCGIGSALKMCCQNNQDPSFDFDKNAFLEKARKYIESEQLSATHS